VAQIGYRKLPVSASARRNSSVPTCLANCRCRGTSSPYANFEFCGSDVNFWEEHFSSVVTRRLHSASAAFIRCAYAEVLRSDQRRISKSSQQRTTAQIAAPPRRFARMAVTRAEMPNAMAMKNPKTAPIQTRSPSLGERLPLLLPTLTTALPPTPSQRRSRLEQTCSLRWPYSQSLALHCIETSRCADGLIRNKIVALS